MKLTYADVVKKNLTTDEPFQRCTKTYSHKELDDIIANSLANAFEEIDDQQPKADLDEPIICTNPYSDGNVDTFPIVEVTNYQEQDNLPKNVRFIATLRQLREWNDERDKTPEGQERLRKIIKVKEKQIDEYIEQFEKSGSTWDVTTEDIALEIYLSEQHIQELEKKLIQD